MARYILGGDTETTGFLDTGDHRFVEIYLGLWDLDTRELIDAFDERIQPGRSIPIEASRVHGITAPMLAGRPEFRDIADRLVTFMGRGEFVVGHNWLSFDGPFINQELVRAGLPKLNIPVVDTMTRARWATANGKSPSLGELCFAMGVPYDVTKAHGAAYDVQVMMESFFIGRRWGYFADTELSHAA